MKIWFVVTGITDPVLYEAVDKGTQFLGSYAAILNNDSACRKLLEILKEEESGEDQ